MGQHHDSAPSLNYTVISIDSPHMRKDGSNYLKFLLDIDECQGNNPCKNRGICTNLQGNYTCDCSNTEYRGRQCEEFVNWCSDGLCQNGGVCTSQPEGYHCECSSGYTGKNCQFNEGRENDPFTKSFNIQVFK